MSELAEFLSYIASEKGLALNTRLAYQKDLQHYLSFCERKQIDAKKVTLSELRQYIGSLRREELTPRSIARKISSLKQFYQFLLREGRVETNPSELLSILVKTKRLPKHLSIDEAFRLVGAAAREDSEGEVGIRDRALLEFWYATGARVSEVASVEPASFDWVQGLVKIAGKGGRERWVPLSTAAQEWCLKYRDLRHEWIRRTGAKEAKTFFLSRTGSLLSRQAIWKLVKYYAKKAGISRNVWPHMIRHSFATHVVQGGADLRAVQELLGHRSISTTEVYTHLDLENLKVMQLKYHPRG